ncbi:hypothetical protein ACS0TY_029771 [Phlomoides rotata]
MVRFSVDGDDDGNEERPSNCRPPLPKRLRISEINVDTHRRIDTVSVGASTTNFGERPSTAEAIRPEGTVAAQEESESSEDSDTSLDETISTGSSSDSDSSEEEQENQRSGNEVQPTEARANSASNGIGTTREPEGLSGAVSVILMDPDVLDCPICYDPMCSPIYQCENGHIACASCCTTMKNKCPNCCWPIGYNRCRAIEKVLESIRVACRNMPYGCKEILIYSKKLAHEKACSYIPCSCPYSGCDFVAVSKCLYSHFSQQHSSKQFSYSSITPISLDSTQKHVFLQEKSQSTLFILTRSVETFGSFVNVVCIAPSSERRIFSYELMVAFGESSIKLKTFVDVMTKWTTHPPAKMRLLVPSDLFCAGGVLKLDLIIRRNASYLSSM